MRVGKNSTSAAAIGPYTAVTYSTRMVRIRLISSLVPRELVLQREQRPDVDYAELTDDELFELLQKQRRRKFVDRALETV